MSDPYAETDEWPTPSLPARPATHSPDQPASVSTVTGDAREARYAEAIFNGRRDPEPRFGDWADQSERIKSYWGDYAKAAMAVADEEQAVLRAEVERLRASGLDWMNRYAAAVEHERAAEGRLRKVAELADEWATWGTGVVAAASAAKSLRAVLAAPAAAARCSDDALNCAACGTAEPAPVSSGEAGHDEVCEADFIFEAGAWTPCRCAERAPVVAPSAEDGGDRG